MSGLSGILSSSRPSRAEIVRLLSTTDPAGIEDIRRRAEEILLEECGSAVSFRGLIEFSNECINDCYYCGIRKSNSSPRRYRLSRDEIVEIARWCADQGYGSIVLQSGERRDEGFIVFIEQSLAAIKRATKSVRLPDGLGITLSVGEQTRETYGRFFAAGAHRYLLRIETSSPELFRRIRPENQTFAGRLDALRSLKEAGFQVGTGVMIGLSGQTCEDLADDVLFFRDLDADMIGMGPYLVHRETPLGLRPGAGAMEAGRAFHLGLLMIAVCRIVLRDVNIATTTALDAIDPAGRGREMGLRFGANILMPQLTPVEVRRDYLLYDGKPGLGESVQAAQSRIEKLVLSAGRTLRRDDWGDSLHFTRRRASRTGASEG